MPEESLGRMFTRLGVLRIPAQRRRPDPYHSPSHEKRQIRALLGRRS